MKQTTPKEKKTTKKELKQQEKAKYMEYIKQELDDHNRMNPTKKNFVYTVLTHVSRSGMQRQIKVIINGRNMSYHVAQVLDWQCKNDAVVVGGCGMDMGFHLVYTLSGVLYGFGNDGAYKLEHKRL